MAKAPTLIISHWYQLIEDLQASSKDFYASVEEAIRRRQMPDTGTTHVDWREGGPLSARREYLRVMRKEHIFDVCAAPFGNGFFVSWWLGELPSGCLALFLWIPFVGPLLERVFRPITYYRIDTALMFQTSIHAAVLEVVDGLTKEKGLRALTELERKPIMKEFLAR